MKNTLLLTTFLISCLYCGLSNAKEPVDFPVKMEDIELAPLPSINDSESVQLNNQNIKKTVDFPTRQNLDALELAPLPGVYLPDAGEPYPFYSETDDTDDNLTADSDPMGGYSQTSVVVSDSPFERNQFKEKKLHFEKILQGIKNTQNSKISKQAQLDIINKEDKQTYLTPLELALDVLAETDTIRWLIQSGAELEKEYRGSALSFAIRAWENVKLATDKEKAKQIYFENIKLLLSKKTKVPDALDAAIYVEQYDVINFLLDNKYVKPTQSDLSSAVARLNWETIQKILNTGLDINGLSSDHEGHTILMRAVQERRLDIVEKLLEAGADPNKKSFSSNSTLSKLKSPLERAIFWDDNQTSISPDLRIIRALLKAGAKPELTPREWNNIQTSFNKSDKILIKIFIKYQAKGVFLSPTFWKIAKEEDVKEQIKNGEDVNEVGYQGWTPLMYANKYSRHPQEMVALLKENGATGFTSSWNFDLELTPENIQNQIDSGADPNTQKEEREYGSYGNLELKSPLILAIETGNVAAVKKLLENKVALNGAGPLFYALGKKHAWWPHEHPTNLEIVKLLLDAGINPNSTEKRTIYDISGRYDYITSPLIMAVQKDEIELIKLLLKYGADPNQMVDDKIPLMHAIHNLEITKILLQSGADINKRNSKGRNAYFYATERNDNNSGVAEFLLENGIDVDNPRDLTEKEMFILSILIIFVPTLLTFPILRALKKGINKKNLLFVILCSLFSPVGLFFSSVGPIFPWLLSLFIVRCSKENPEIAFGNIRAHKIIRFLAILTTILILIYFGWSLYYAWTSSINRVVF